MDDMADAIKKLLEEGGTAEELRDRLDDLQSISQKLSHDAQRLAKTSRRIRDRSDEAIGDADDFKRE